MDIGYDIITWVILGAAVIYYFLIPAASDAVDVRNKARKKPTDDEGSE